MRDTLALYPLVCEILNPVLTRRCREHELNHARYDNWGNLLQKNVTQGTAENLQVTVDVHNHINTSGFTYDAAGNLIWAGFTALTFDAENRLTPATGYVYAYDGD